MGSGAIGCGWIIDKNLESPAYQTQWPDVGSDHSDLKNIAFVYQSKFFLEMVQEVV
jgi:hypothetical protein